MNRILICPLKLAQGTLASSCLWEFGTYLKADKEGSLNLGNWSPYINNRHETNSLTLLHSKLQCVGSLDLRYCYNPATIRRLIVNMSHELAYLFPCTIVECQGRPAVELKESVNVDLLPRRVDNKLAGGTTVVLHDEQVTTESLLRRGCHTLFSWTVFASLWSSVIAFPIVTLLNVANGAWTSVMSIAGVWVCSLLFRLPSSVELRRFLCQGLHKWFPYVDIVYEEEPQVVKSIFCCHPHGVFSIGAALLLDDLNYHELPDGSGGRREVAIVAAPFLRWCNPLFKWLTDLTDIHIHGAGRKEFRKLLDTGQACALIPGGFSEATITCVGKERIFVKDRKGFIKYALRAGYSLTPVYVFGESDLYHNPQGLWTFRLYLNTLYFQLPAVVPFGYALAPLAPRRIPIRIVCGPALELPRIENPTDDDVNLYHAKYVTAVEQLFYRHVKSYHEDVYCKYVTVGRDEGPRTLEKW